MGTKPSEQQNKPALVTPLTDKEENKGKDKKKFAAFRINFIRTIQRSLRSESTRGLPAFEHKFIFYQPHSHNDAEPVEILPNGCCRRVTEKRIRDCILEYYEKKILYKFADDILGYPSTQDLYECVRAGVETVSKIGPIGFKDDPGYYWTRLDFDRPARDLVVDPKVVCPHYYEFYYMRFDAENRDAVMAFNGSALVPTSDRSQALVIVGKGGQGKGRHMYFYDQLFGKGFGCTDVALPRKGQNQTTEEEKFVTECADVRLALAEDKGQTNFFNSDFFRKITGNPNHRGRKVYNSAANYQLDVKIVCDSNYDPIFEDNRETFRRIIYTGLKTLDIGGEVKEKSQKEMNDLFQKERVGILQFWLQTYWRLCPKGEEVIPCDTSKLKAIASRCFGDYEEFASHFEFGPELYVESFRVKELIRRYFGTDTPRGGAYRSLTDYMWRHYGARPGGRADREQINGKQEFVWRGMALASDRPEPGHGF